MAINQARDRRLEVRMSLSGTPWAMNVLHMRAAADLANTNAFYADAFMDSLEGNAAYTTYRALLANVVTFQSLTVNNIGGGIPGVRNISLPGTDATELVPRNVSYLVMCDTSELKIKGRTYLWGYAEAHNGADGLPSAAEAASLAYCDALQTAAAAAFGAGSSLAVFSRAADILVPIVGFRRASSSTNRGWQTQGRRRTPLIP